MGRQQGADRIGDLTNLQDALLEFFGILPGARQRAISALAMPLVSLVARAGEWLIGRDLAAHYPDQHSRMQGIAAGARIPVHWLFLAPSLELMLNRTIYATPPAGACTAVAIAGARSATGEPIIAKNFDYPRAGLDSYLARRSRPTGRISSLDVTHSPIPGCHEGLNERGLAVAYNYGSFRGRAAARVSITTLLQEMLEGCATVSEAIALMSARPRAGGALLMLADADGELASVELAPDTFSVRRGQTLVHTNHAQTREIEGRDVPKEAVFPRWWRPRAIAGTRIRESSERRHDRADEIVRRYGAASERDLVALLSDHGAGSTGDDLTICRHGPYYATTCSVLLYPRRRAMKLRFGAPCEGDFSELSL
jgi:hypothetical protein